MAEINLENLEQGSLKKKIMCKKNFYEHPQSESQPGFPFFLPKGMIIRKELDH